MEHFRMSNAPRIRESGLGYYLHDGSTAFRFQLSGVLSGDGVRELEQTWRTASSVIGGRCLVVDLSFVTGMDRAGRELLATWQVEGACIVVTSSAAKERIESLMNRPVTLLGTKPKPYTWPPFRVAPRWVAALLVLLFPTTVGTVNLCGANSTSANCANCAGMRTRGSSNGEGCRPSPR